MSYIRCLSNPEGLYIWGGRRNVNITGGPDVEPGMTEPEQWRSMPIELWEKLLETWTKTWYDNVDLTMVIDGVKHEVTLTERVSPMKPGMEEMFAARDRGEELEVEEYGRMKVCITYKNENGESWKLDDIWPVTMHYIADRYANPYYGAGRVKRLILRLLGV